MSFADATALRPLAPGRFAATVPSGWDIAGATNGGYLLALVARAVIAATGRADPVTVTAHYLARARPGDVTVDVQTHDDRRSRATATAFLRTSDGTLLLVALATVGSLAEPGDAASVLVDARPPDLPPPRECVALEPTESFPPPFVGRVGLRLHPDDVPFVQGRTSPHARIRGWFELLDGEPLSSLALLLAADAFPPAIFTTDLPVAWTPTLELTVQLRGRPAAGPLACEFRTRVVSAGYLEADGELWDASGSLVALSRQLALVPRGS